MLLYDFLHQHMQEILTDACSSMRSAHAKHYEVEGPEPTLQRLKALFTLTARAVKERNLGPMVAHAERIAQERFTAGFDLWEVQTAFNVLEESMWKHIIQHLPPAEYAEALGLVGTILGAGKDVLARKYVSLASHTNAPSLDMQSIFTGGETAT